jgi:regulator of replication initiation timing
MSEINNSIIENLKAKINELNEQRKVDGFKIKSVMAKNEKLERENEMLRKQIEENTWNEIDKDDEDGK